MEIAWKNFFVNFTIILVGFAGNLLFGVPVEKFNFSFFFLFNLLVSFGPVDESGDDAKGPRQLVSDYYDRGWITVRKVSSVKKFLKIHARIEQWIRKETSIVAVRYTGNKPGGVH